MYSIYIYCVGAQAVKYAELLGECHICLSVLRVIISSASESEAKKKKKKSQTR